MVRGSKQIFYYIYAKDRDVHGETYANTQQAS